MWEGLRGLKLVLSCFLSAWGAIGGQITRRGFGVVGRLWSRGHHRDAGNVPCSLTFVYACGVENDGRRIDDMGALHAPDSEQHLTPSGSGVHGPSESQ